MFTWLNKQGVQSDDGFIVQSVDRFAIEYREDERVMTIPVERGMLAGEPCVIVDPSAFARWDHSVDTLLNDEQSRIRFNFVAAMEFQGMAVDL